jgi:hypothetical protein
VQKMQSLSDAEKQIVERFLQILTDEEFRIIRDNAFPQTTGNGVGARLRSAISAEDSRRRPRRSN